MRWVALFSMQIYYNVWGQIYPIYYNVWGWDGCGVILMGTMCAGLHFFSKTSCWDTWLHKWHPLHPTILLHSNPLPAATQYLLAFTISQQPRQGHLRSKLIVKVMEFLSNTTPWAMVLCSTLHWKNSMWEFETTANLNSAQFWICTSFGSNFKYHSHVNSVWIQICLT